MQMPDVDPDFFFIGVHSRSSAATPPAVLRDLCDLLFLFVAY